jgi:hypothetical protein
MRGLAFPSNAVYNREASYDGAPQHNNLDTIPIDPALSGSVIDPAIAEEESRINDEPVSTLIECCWFWRQNASCLVLAHWLRVCMSDKPVI